MDNRTLMDRLAWIASAKPGDDFPDWLGGPGSQRWGGPLTELATAVLARIKELEDEIVAAKQGWGDED
jgi:hypothetical protein